MVTKAEIANLNFISTNDALPETNGGTTRVYIKRSNGSVTRGMFFINGTKPEFAGYGTEITDAVAWAYRW